MVSFRYAPAQRMAGRRRPKGKKEEDANNAAQEIKSFAKSLLAVRGVSRARALAAPALLPSRPASLPVWPCVCPVCGRSSAGG